MVLYGIVTSPEEVEVGSRAEEAVTLGRADSELNGMIEDKLVEVAIAVGETVSVVAVKTLDVETAPITGAEVIIEAVDDLALPADLREVVVLRYGAADEESCEGAGEDVMVGAEAEAVAIPPEDKEPMLDTTAELDAEDGAVWEMLVAPEYKVGPGTMYVERD